MPIVVRAIHGSRPAPYNQAMSPNKGCLSTLAILVMLLLFGCGGTSDFIDPRVLPSREISGRYRSDSIVGALGRIQLDLARVEESRVYAARIMGEDPEQFGSADGIGTLADNHMVMHFDRGEAYDYYFEGTVLGVDGATSISGEFIFPDQKENLPVSFSLVQ